tara:strand:+ start:435 stop:638 length:204 start_codon:yes stop_codon:yes gene_type:complete
MLVIHKSVLTGQSNVRDLDITEDQLLRWLNGALIQRAFPQLSADDREFIITGILPEEWDLHFPEEEE